MELQLVGSPLLKPLINPKPQPASNHLHALLLLEKISARLSSKKSPFCGCFILWQGSEKSLPATTDASDSRGVKKFKKNL
jgi:hypothetical protein